MRKTILLIDLADTMGGVETYLDNLHTLMSPYADIELFTTVPPLAAIMSAKGVPIYTLPKYLSYFKPIRFLSAAFYVAVLLHLKGIDVVQVNGYLESIFIPISRLCGKKAVYTRHGPTELELYKWYLNPLRFLVRYISLICMRYSSRIVCVSRAVAASLEGRLPAPRIEVVANWVQNHLPVPPSIWSYELPIRVLYIGRLERYKGLQTLIEAVRGLSGIELVVVGDGSYKTDLESLSFGINVRFEGFQSNVERYYESSHLFVMPSLGPEGLPMVTIEAMGRGLPCILSNLPVHIEVSESSKAAALFRVGDASDLRAKLLELLGDQMLREAYGKNASERVRSLYSTTAALQGYLRIFDVTSNV